MPRKLVLAALSIGAALAISACGAGVEDDAPAATTQVATPNPEAPVPEPGQTNAQARADELAGDPSGVTPGPEATAGATAEDVSAAQSPAEAAAASGGGTSPTPDPSR